MSRARRLGSDPRGADRRCLSWETVIIAEAGAQKETEPQVLWSTYRWGLEDQRGLSEARTGGTLCLRLVSLELWPEATSLTSFSFLPPSQCRAASSLL